MGPKKIAKCDPKKAKYDLICYEKIFVKIKKKRFVFQSCYLFTYACTTITLLDFLAILIKNLSRFKL
jgi:hypothetical protein